MTYAMSDLKRQEKNRAVNEMPRWAAAQSSDVSCIHRGRALHSRGPAEQNDLSPTVCSSKNWVAVLWPLANLSGREETLVWSNSDGYDGSVRCVKLLAATQADEGEA